MSGPSRDYVTFEIAGRMFGAEVSSVHDVFRLQHITPVPLSRPDVAGLLNLRGRIVTAVDARRRLGLPDRAPGAPAPMAIGVELGAESYALIVDRVGDVLSLDGAEFEANPTNLDEAWKEVARGVFRLETGLLVALDIHCMLDPPAALAA